MRTRTSAEVKNNIKMIKKRTSPIYVPPLLWTIEAEAQSIICQSRGNESMQEVYYGDGGFEEEEYAYKNTTE